MRAHVGSAPGRRDGAFESNCSDASSDEGMIRPEEEVENEDKDEDEDVDEDEDEDEDVDEDEDEDEDADKDEEDCADAVDVSGRLPTRLGTDLVADKDADKDDDADGMRSSTLRMCALVCAEYDGASCGRESSEEARR